MAGRRITVVMMMELLIVILIEVEANDIAPSPSPFPVRLPHFSELDKVHEGRGPLTVCVTNQVELACAHLPRSPFPQYFLYDLCVINGIIHCMTHLSALDDPAMANPGPNLKGANS
ncbi:hypothetical protein CJ030_MR1G027077 [Morella rubra]|uniref:Uncharacterized protein n=1 Tax=Morella rubra TaxID=262757 RepID=A0A6A1WIB2_9ROSI|nr:hypothetical protein CJ030_MR1G027077 [Morella rubra]